MKLKNLFAVALMACASSAAFAAPYSATGAGTSTVGSGGDYATLGAAVAAINAAGSRDASQWVLEIVSDTTEATNFGLFASVDPAGSILIRPATGTTPTVTFTATADNDGPSGHFLIGANLTGGTTWTLGTTNNVIIDGNNGAIDRALTITNTTANAHTFSSIVSVVGSPIGVQIRNARILNVGVGTTSCSAIGIRPRNQSATNFIPTNFQIVNNELSCTGSAQGHGINVLNSGTITAGNAPSGFLIDGNDISARIRGIFGSPIGAGTISGNRIAVGLGGTTNAISTFGIFHNTNNGSASALVISGNSIDVVTNNAVSTNGPSGIFLATHGAGSSATVTNNTVRIRNTSTAARPTLARGIVATSGIVYTIRHNTIDIAYDSVPAVGSVNPAYVYGLGQFLGSATLTIENNLISNRVPGGAAYWRPNAPTGTYALNENLINIPSGTIGTNIRTFASSAGSPTRASSGTTRTIFTGTTAHGLAVGDIVTVGANALSGNVLQYEGTFTVTTVPTTTSFTYEAGTSLTEAATAQAFSFAATSPATINAATLAAWQGTTGTPDLASAASDPTASLNLNDLHLLDTLAANLTASAQVGGIVTDIDGEARALTPTRGADEFAANVAPSAISAVAAAGVAENLASATLITRAFGIDANPFDDPIITAVSSAGTVAVVKTGTRFYQVNLTSALDFETTPSIDVTLTATDRAGATTQQIINIPVTNVNEAPTAISPTTASVDENVALGTVVTALSTTDPDAGDTFTYTLVAGAGDTDNALFAISGGDLVTNAAFDFETAPGPFSVRVRSTDAGALFVEGNISITVNNVNDAPSDINLSGSTVNDNAPIGTVIGILTSVDQDAGQTHSYALVSGAGDADNGLVTIVGDELRLNGVLDFASNPTLEIRISTTDNGSPALSFEKEFVITVNASNVSDWMQLLD